MQQPAAVWRDLAALAPWEAAKELLLPLPWLAASLVLAGHDLYPLALGAVSILASVVGSFFARLGSGPNAVINALYRPCWSPPSCRPPGSSR